MNARLPATRRLAEQPLKGGATLGAVRIGRTVHRATRPWTATVHTLLRFLEDNGFAGAPRVLGRDDQGREVLSFLPGQTVGDASSWPGWVFSDLALRQVGGWLRRLHDTTSAFAPPPDAVWFGDRAWEPGYVIGHHDAGPRNAVWRGRLVGFVDWDTAGPAPRESDLAMSALWWVPLTAVSVARRTGFTAFGDRRRRLHALLDAYGYGADRADFREHVLERIREEAKGIRVMAAQGDPVYQAMTAEAVDLDSAVGEVASLPASFWAR